MRRDIRILGAVVFALCLVLPTVSMASAQSATTVVVKPYNVGPNGPWYLTTTDASVNFVNGPTTPPLGGGSVEFVTNNPLTGRVRLYTNDWIGTPLADIQDITFATYRSSASTNPEAQYPFIVLQVDYAGDGTTSANFYWEPAYVYGQENLKTDTWQTWDTQEASKLEESGGGWWTDSDGVPGFVSGGGPYVSWATLLNDFPNAKINGFIALGIGNGWGGQFIGNADALSITVSGNTTTYDFEPLVGPPASKSQCFNGGWRTFDNPAFRNQGDCVSFVEHQQPHGNGH